ncbi:MAG: TIGR01777 family oxidoreductase [Colwellia sp.]|nr:TIGR01777 family oxidoreductase [Colwellia sp.]
MNFLITGGTGFIGSALCSRLLIDNHEITLLSRTPEKVKPPVNAIAAITQLTAEATFDIVINLAGEPIANKRWSDQQKQQILNSRIDTTQHLITFLKKVEIKPKLFISGSALGYYGTGKTNKTMNEQSAGDGSFSSQLCQQWEAVASQAEVVGIRTCLLRTGIVLGKGGGALSKMSLPFKMGLGGRIGDGKQWMSWIHLNDLIGIILFCITHETLFGAINGTSPNPVTNQTFTKTLGVVLNRPTLLAMPEFILKLLMGQMAEELLLSGKRILPIKISAAGYDFQYNNLEEALINSL